MPPLLPTIASRSKLSLLQPVYLPPSMEQPSVVLIMNHHHMHNRQENNDAPVVVIVEHTS